MAAELATTLVATDDELLEQAEATVRAYCGWHIAPVRTEDVVLDATDSPVLMLPTLRLLDVAAITVDGEVVDPATVQWSATGYLRRHWTAGLDCPRTWGNAPRSVTITITHGWATPPPGVTGVVRALAARAKGNSGGLVSMTRGPFSETYATELFATEQTALAPYKIPPRP